MGEVPLYSRSNQGPTVVLGGGAQRKERGCPKCDHLEGEGCLEYDNPAPPHL